VDRAVLALVRLVQAEPWSDGEAAAELRRQGHGDRALALARARVAAAAIERPSVYADRAIATLNSALALDALGVGDADMTRGAQRPSLTI
jgi:hypothetical protein